MQQLPIEISPHARRQMQERGVEENEVISAIGHGDSEPARGNRCLHRKSFQFDKSWRGRHYRIKQVAPIVEDLCRCGVSRKQEAVISEQWFQ